MKKSIGVVLILTMLSAFVACGGNETEINEEQAPNVTEVVEEQAPETTGEIEKEQLFTTIEAKNCFYDAGFVELIAGAEASSEYTFTAENSEAVEWCIYIFDEAFDDSLRYIKQISEPVLIGDGTIFIAEGQYVYVYCSANEFTTGVVDDYAKLNVTVK